MARVDLEAEAIRLARLLLTSARTPARTDAKGNPVTLADQDRTRWNKAAVAEGSAWLTDDHALDLPRALEDGEARKRYAQSPQLDALIARRFHIQTYARRGRCQDLALLVGPASSSTRAYTEWAP